MWMCKRASSSSLLTLFYIITIKFNSSLSKDSSIYSLKLRTAPQSTSTFVKTDVRIIDDVLVRRRRQAGSATDDVDLYWVPARGNLRGKAGLGYYIEMDIGTPPQNLHVLVDTGSSNFAVAAAPHDLINTYYHTDESSTYKDLKRKVKVPYTQGEWDGKLSQDKSRIVSGPNVAVMANIAGITHSEEFFINGSNWQGILGLGYAGIARPDSTVEPFFDTLVREGHVDNIFAMQLCGSNSGNKSTVLEPTEAEVTGTMTVGGVDNWLYNGTMWYTPLLRERFYEVVIVDMEVNNVSLALDCKEYNFDKTIVDSGTTNLRLPEKVFDVVRNAIEADIPLVDVPVEFWTGEHLLCKQGPIEPWNMFPTITIALQSVVDGQAFKLVISPKQYLRSVNADGEDCYKYGVSKSDTGAVIGAVVMEGFYVVFDRANKSIGFALSTCAEQMNFAPRAPDVIGPLYINSTGCAYNASPEDNSVLLTVAYIMAGFCVIFLMVPLVFLYVHWQMERCRIQKEPDMPEDDGLLEPNESES